MIFNKEWEADLYALILLMHIGDVQTVKLYLDRHPEKVKWALLAAVVSVYKAIPRLLTAPFRRFLNLFPRGRSRP